MAFFGVNIGLFRRLDDRTRRRLTRDSHSVTGVRLASAWEGSQCDGVLNRRHMDETLVGRLDSDSAGASGTPLAVCDEHLLTWALWENCLVQYRPAWYSGVQSCRLISSMAYFPWNSLLLLARLLFSGRLVYYRFWFTLGACARFSCYPLRRLATPLVLARASYAC